MDAPARDQLAIRIPFSDVAHAESRTQGAWFAVQTYKGAAVIIDFGRGAKGAGDVAMNQLDAFQRATQGGVDA